MASLVAIVLVFLGLIAVAASWNAVRPVIDPTRRYSPWWLPAMVVAELAPFWLLVTATTIGAGVAFGATDSWGGRIGLALLAVAGGLLVVALVRAWRAARRIRRTWVSTPIPDPGPRARLVGRPVRMPHGVVEERRVPWSAGHTVDIVRPATIDPGRPRRIAIYVHGGGWTRGDPQRQARDLYRALAWHGWTVVAIRYPFPPAVSVEEQIAFVRSAISRARRLDGMPAASVVIAGGSAGGHLAAMAALTPASAAERVDACIGMYAIYDMANRNRTRAPWRMIRTQVMGEGAEEAPERYRSVSPLDRVHAGSPPFLVVHGTHDTLVPVAEATQFVDELRRLDRPVDVLLVDGAQHAFDGVSAPRSRAVAAAIAEWIGRRPDAPG